MIEVQTIVIMNLVSLILDKHDYSLKQIFILIILVSLLLSKGTTFDDAFILFFQ